MTDSGIVWNPVSKEFEEARNEVFGPQSNQLDGIISEPHGITAPKAMEATAKKVFEFELRPDDIWIVTYPKCGTTMTQEMVWQIVNKVDREAAKKVPLWVRTPFLEMEGLFIPEYIEEFKKAPMDKEMIEAMIHTVDYTHNLKSPRVIKTHLPFEFLPPQLLDTCKVIFVCRNPKDCCVSFYHHHITFPEYQFNGDFEKFAKMFLNGNMEYGGYWTMLKSAWKRKDHPNMKIIWFEDMRKDLITVIRDVSKFLGRHMTELKILQLDDHLYIDNFREIITEGFGGEESMRKFIRKGKVGDWKNHFTAENSKIWDDWIASHLSGTDIVLPNSSQ